METGMIVCVEELYIYALYSHPLKAKNKDTTVDIG